MSSSEARRVREGLARHEQELLAAPTTFHRYEILGRLGGGATSIVYRARDKQLDRIVALKTLRLAVELNEMARKRFVRECRASARLSHPNLVTVYDGGESNGHLFLAMELVTGESLQRLLDRKSGELRSKIALIEKVAQGLQHAHEIGIVHRDVKPANILVTDAGEPKVADFGLAHLMEGGGSLTRSGAAVGTPCYMAPEQVRGNPKEITPATDVYALGVILYEMSTGRPPYTGRTMTEIFARIVGDEPIPPTHVEANVPRELEAIILKAMEKDSSRRYGTAGDLADDLARFRAGEPVRARPPTTMRKAYRILGRYRTVLAVMAALLFSGAAWFGVSTWQKTDRLRQALLQAHVFESEGRLEEAQNAFHRAADLDPTCTEAREGIGRAEAELRRRNGNTEAALARAAARMDALERIEKVRRGLDHARRSLYSRASDGVELRRQAKESRMQIEAAIADVPDLAIGHYLIGQAWEIEGWPEKAEASWRRTIELKNDFAPAHYQLARILLGRSFLTSLGGTEQDRRANRTNAKPLTEEALLELDTAVSIGSGFEDDVQRELAEAMRSYLRLDWETVTKIVSGAVAKFGSKEGIEDLHWIRGLLLTGPAQRRAYEQALAIRPKHSLVLFCLGYAKLAEGERDAALADYDEAIRLHPRFVEAYLHRAALHVAMGRREAAIDDYTEILKIDPDRVGALVNRGNLLVEAGDKPKALRDYEAAVKIDPRHAMARYNRAKFRATEGDLDGAQEDLTIAMESDPQDPDFPLSRAEVRLKMKDPRGAESDLSRAIALAPKGWRFRSVAESLLTKARLR